MNTPQHLQQRLRKQFRIPYDHMVVTNREYLFPHNRNKNFLLIQFQFIEGPTFRDHQCIEKWNDSIHYNNMESNEQKEQFRHNLECAIYMTMLYFI